jgi:two-component system, OmpR family, sensor histidine kinase BaeS
MNVETGTLKSKISISIKSKLFITMLIGACTLVLCLFLLIQWSFNRGFLQYANTLEQERFTILSEKINDHYEQYENWDFLRGKARVWVKFLVSSAPEQFATKTYLRSIEREIRSGRFYSSESLLPGMAHIFENRVYLLDGDQQVLFGSPPTIPSSDLETINYQGAIVGYLGLLPGEVQYNAQQLHFLNKQMVEFNIAAGLMILLAASCSLPLAHRIVKPVNSLAASVRALAMGDFKVRAKYRSRDELGQFTQDFNFMAMTLENNRKARQQFFADISHELKTPLAVLQAEIEAIQDGVHQPTQGNMDKLHHEVTHLNNMVNDISELSLSDIGALSYHKEEFDLALILIKKTDHYCPEFSDKKITFETLNLTDTKLPVFADPKRMQQLISNLLDNSLKYTSSGGRITINLERHRGSFSLHIQDSAPTVPQEELPKLFEHFYRADNARDRSEGGTGLGLAICKKIVEAHEGNIEILPSPLGGLWVKVTLPMDG